MKEEKIQELIKNLFSHKCKVKSYDGGYYDSKSIQKEAEANIESIIRSFILDNRDEKMGTLEAKVFMYEEIISKSNFAPMLENTNK